ncbi:hypothetical protein RclHR1_01590013 [Rhizophagus clarus]|uniref:Uncharacterized protein n=1 Tax=Rhizophagus clarus TaxID=94130 RepID=A0A2Z6R930_9GLOM|nr:hypothetical protein RclHR1_01590013 [Rhizophagus clarus]
MNKLSTNLLLHLLAQTRQMSFSSRPIESTLIARFVVVIRNVSLFLSHNIIQPLAHWHKSYLSNAYIIALSKIRLLDYVKVRNYYIETRITNKSYSS